MKSKNRLDVIVPERYLKSNIFNSIDELLIGAIKSLRDEGKGCEFLGFNILNGHVVLIEGIKYCTTGERGYNLMAFSYEVFYIVEDAEHDYIENRLKERVEQILEILGDKETI